jgi:hypothetical protein
MADSAFQIQYRQEFIAQFEQGASWLRTICTTEAVVKGNQAMFLVAGPESPVLDITDRLGRGRAGRSDPLRRNKGMQLRSPWATTVQIRLGKKMLAHQSSVSVRKGEKRAEAVRPQPKFYARYG